jgi:hypothetical protein
MEDAAHGDDGGTGGFGETSAVDADRPSLDGAQRQIFEAEWPLLGGCGLQQACGMRHTTWDDESGEQSRAE